MFNFTDIQSKSTGIHNSHVQHGNIYLHNLLTYIYIQHQRAPKMIFLSNVFLLTTWRK